MSKLTVLCAAGDRSLDMTKIEDLKEARKIIAQFVADGGALVHQPSGARLEASSFDPAQLAPGEEVVLIPRVTAG